MECILSVAAINTGTPTAEPRRESVEAMEVMPDTKAERPESNWSDGLVGVAGRPGDVDIPWSSSSTMRLLRLRGRSYSTDGSGVSDTNCASAGASTGC
jgi:hypothetical protein